EGPPGFVRGGPSPRAAGVAPTQVRSHGQLRPPRRRGDVMSSNEQRSSTLLPDPDPREVHNLLISVDDHVIEPAHMFEGRMPKSLDDVAPKVFYREDGVAGWIFEDQTQPNMGLNAVAGRPADEKLNEPTGWDQMRPGCYEINARIADMDIN